LYQSTLNTSRKLVNEKPDLVQRAVDCIAKGWASYLNGDAAPANALIKKDNPDMTDEKIAYAISAMKSSGMVESGDAKTLGIGAMTDERMASFFDKMVRAGVVKSTIDYRQGYTLRFVNKAVGVELRPKN
jgi:NitT/TauT family transport system substrate-binding protein